MSNLNRGMFTSATDEWATPDDFFARAVEMFGAFDLDPCCLESSAKAENFFTPDENGLEREWFGQVWMNPPYGRTIGQWTAKARQEVESGNADRVVGLLPCRTDTKWWHENVMGAGEILLVKGRLKFGASTNSAPFPSCIVVWVPGKQKPELGVI